MQIMDALGIEPRAFRMRSRFDTTTPRALAMSDGQAIGSLRGTHALIIPMTTTIVLAPKHQDSSISGLVVEYIVAIDVTRVRFPADAYFEHKVMLLRHDHMPRPPSSMLGRSFWAPPSGWEKNCPSSTQSPETTLLHHLQLANHSGPVSPVRKLAFKKAPSVGNYCHSRSAEPVWGGRPITMLRSPGPEPLSPPPPPA